MGREYYLVKPDKKERFCLGKGYWSKVFYPPEYAYNTEKKRYMDGLSGEG